MHVGRTLFSQTKQSGRKQHEASTDVSTLGEMRNPMRRGPTLLPDMYPLIGLQSRFKSVNKEIHLTAAGRWRATYMNGVRISSTLILRLDAATPT